MKPTRSPWFWAAYATLSIASLVLTAKLFPLAIPLVNLDVRMTRDEAIDKGQALAARLHLAPADSRVAARFDHDSRTQNYIELEGGGRSAFAQLAASGVYAPYWWEARLFRLGEIDETIIRFDPDGRPNGFLRRVAETYLRDPATKALSVDQARALAETRAKEDWGIDFARYTLHDQSQQTLPSGRVDHAFVYEQPETKYGEARVRLRLAVSGDELTGVAPFVFVPESFERRFQELRSANNLIAGVASASAGVLYGLGGCMLGILWLLRNRWLQWRPAFFAGLVVGGLLACASLASAPGAWFSVDTTETVATFWTKQVGAFIFTFAAGGVGYAIAFMAAESLSRRAFPHQPQLWRVWSREAGATRQILGRTLGGYLFVPVELALVMAFYYATNRWLGWWQPSEMLSDPDILSSSIPALHPIALSLQAGAMEECVFRAIPLALGAIIGSHFGYRRAGIAIAFVLQALVFGGAHANYPGFPSYSRLVELIVPSMIWAAIFLRFGLVPTVILHAVFDLVLFSIPVFLIHSGGARVQQALIVMAAFLPLAVLLLRRLQSGAWGELPPALYNAAFVPRAERPVAAADTTGDSRADAPRVALAFQRALPWLGLAGLVLWALNAPFRIDVPSLPLTRDAAIAKADQALAERGASLGPEWRRMAVVRVAPDEASQWQWHKFVWREAGPAVYRAQVGAALAPPAWEIRYARFDGDVAERAEEWRVAVSGDGRIRTVRHQLPQGRPGATLTREAALAIAERELRTRFDLDPTALKLVAADEDKRDARTDWSFMFTDPKVDVGQGGEVRYVIMVTGDQVAGSGRIIYVPEAWQRAERERDNRHQIVKLSAAIIVSIAGLAAVVLGVIGWTRGRCDTRAMRLAAALTFVLAIVGLANAWPLQAMQLRTAEPVASQWFMAILGVVVGGLFAALVSGLTAGIGAWYARTAPRSPIAGWLRPWQAGIAASLFVAGLEAALSNLGPRGVPLWPSLSTLALWSPLAGAVVGGLGFVALAGVALFVVYVVARVTDDWRKHAWAGVAIIVALDCAIAIGQGAPSLGAALMAGAITGLATAALLWLLLRFDATAVPAFVATGVTLSALLRAMQIGTMPGYAIAAVGIAVTAVGAVAVTRYIARPLAPKGTDMKATAPSSSTA